jgi:hypothetical protein
LRCFRLCRWPRRAGIADIGSADSVRQGKIFKGAKPAGLPVVRSTRFAFVIDLQTARMLAIEVQPSLLATADEMIEWPSPTSSPGRCCADAPVCVSGWGGGNTRNSPELTEQNHARFPIGAMHDHRRAQQLAFFWIVERRAGRWRDPAEQSSA